MPDLADDLATDFPDNLYWDPDCPPANGLLAESDEFSGSALNAKWSLWRPGGAGELSVSVVNGQGELSMSSAGTSATGIYQPVPVGISAFSFAAKLTGSMLLNASAARYGIMIAEDLTTNPTTADTRSAGSRVDTGGTSGICSGSLLSYNAAYTEATNFGRRDSSVYVRGRVTGIGTAPVVSWDWSDAATGYQGMQNAIATFAPVHFGLWCRAVAGVPLTARVEWFRVMAGDVGLSSMLPGGRLIPFT